MKICQLVNNDNNNKEDKTLLKIKWITFQSKKLGEVFVFLLDKKYYKEARNKFPDLAIYFKQEIEELWNVWKFENSNNDNILKIHSMKKMFRGWILPDNI